MEPSFEQVDFDKSEYDLNYAGTFRGGRREVDMVKFFLDYEMILEYKCLEI